MGTNCFIEQKNQKKEKIHKVFDLPTNIIETIKSKYIINDIFSYLYENKKLELVKYNKKSQKKWEIDINYYKQISGKFIIGERNGKGKEYNEENELLFEGEYLNGNKWNGKGYDKRGNIDFEIKNGKGYIKEYDKDGILEFEGEYINGKRSGKGKDYYNDGNLIFEGEYLNGELL